MKNTTWHRLLKLLSIGVIALLITACGSNNRSNNLDSNLSADSNGVSLRVPVPDAVQDNFCAKFEVSGSDMQTIIVEEDYPQGAQFIDSVLTDIPAGSDRKLALGIFEGRDCGELDDADWLATTDGIQVTAGEVTRVSLNLVNTTTGTIIVSGQFEKRELHGEVVSADGTPISGAKCDIFEDDTLASSTVSLDDPLLLGVLDEVVDVNEETEFLLVSCDHDNFNPETAVAELRGDPGGFQIFGVTVVMRSYLSEASIKVDRSLQSSLPDLPAINANGNSRALAVLVDERGRVGHFAERELMLVSNDFKAVEKFVKKWDGELLASTDFSNVDADLENIHLVRINTDLADTDKVVENLRAIDGEARGAHKVSSESGLGLIAAGAQAARDGMKVGMNWVGKGDSISSGSTAESPMGPGNFNPGGSYTSDAFDWNYMDSGSNQDIGVAPAWQLLSNLGQLGNRSRLAILDMGFVPLLNGDIATDFIARSNVPFVAAIGTSNLGSCGSPCPWHGTNVANAAMGLVDNNLGAAGPGGPVARPVLVFTSYDFFTSITAVTIAFAEGARIMNMSYSAPVPAIVSWSVLPFEIVTNTLHAAGAIMTASAGNSSENVDAEDCGPFGLICWEETWHTPCENGGVMCVGGIGIDTRNKDSGSSFGNQQVDIFAPYSLMVGRDGGARRPTEQAYLISGTSFSAPFVAGAAALVSAANPSLSGPEIQRVLERTAHTSPDPRVRRSINVLAAVREALGTAVNIISPIEGSQAPRGQTVTFRAEAFSNERSGASYAWTSSRQGAIGTGSSFSRIDLDMGLHTITVVATFDDGFAVSDSVQLEIINTPPRLFIDSPASGQRFTFSEPILLRGRSVDTNNPESGFMLRDSQVRWTVGGISAGTGHAQTLAGSSLSVGGPYTVRFIGSDGISTVEESTTIFIDPDPVDRRPVVRISQPSNNSTFIPNNVDALGQFIDVTVNWSAEDPEDGFLSFADTQWTTRINGGAEQPLRVNVIFIGLPGSPIRFPIYRMRLYAPFSFNNAHEIRLRATDSSGNVGQTTVRVNVTNLS